MHLRGQMVTLVPEPKVNLRLLSQQQSPLQKPGGLGPSWQHLHQLSCIGSLFAYTLGERDAHTKVKTCCISAERVSGGQFHLLGFLQGPSTSSCLLSLFRFLLSMSTPYPG